MTAIADRGHLLFGGGWVRSLLIRLGLVFAALLPGIAEGGMWTRHPLTTVVNLFVSIAFVGAGALMSADAEQRGTGRILIAAGVTIPLDFADEWAWGPWPLYAAVFGLAGLTLGAWALLRFPRPGLSAHGRWFMRVLPVWLIGVPAVQVCFGRPAWAGDYHVNSTTWWPYLWTDQQVYDRLSDVFAAGVMVLAVWYLWLLGHQLRLGGRGERAIRLPIVAAGTLAAVTSAAVEIVTLLDGPHEEVFAIHGMAELTVPVAFLVAYGQQRLVRLSRLLTQADGAVSTVPLLRELLRHNLRDPGLDLAVWSEESLSYRTVEGISIDIGAVPADRRVEVRGKGDRLLALLLLGPDALRIRDLQAAAAVMSRLALENMLLSQRLLTAADDARRSIEADLHDGAQNQLVTLRMALEALRDLPSERWPRALDHADHLIDEALREMRDLAHGIYPHTLTHAGLGPAIEETANRLDLTVQLSVPAERLPGAVEKTIYFFANEGLTNARKHAEIDRLKVSIRRDGSAVVAEIRDEGAGGAAADGTGLAQMRDRVEAHGGRLDIVSVLGKGTHLIARIPCV